MRGSAASGSRGTRAFSPFPSALHETERHALAPLRLTVRNALGSRPTLLLTPPTWMREDAGVVPLGHDRYAMNARVLLKDLRAIAP